MTMTIRLTEITIFVLRSESIADCHKNGVTVMKTTVFVLLIASWFSVSLSVSVSAQTFKSGSDAGESGSLTGSVVGVGGNISALSGSGFSFRHHLPNRFSYMLTSYAYKTHSEGSWNYGVEVQYDFLLKEKVRFYLLVGASHYYHFDRNLHEGTQNDYEGPDRFGGGLGLETPLIGDDLCFSFNWTLTSFQPIGDLIPYPYGGLHYYFR
jgi:hypothetical protein